MKDQSELDAEELAVECRKAVHCLYLEVPLNIANDIASKLHVLIISVADKLREKDASIDALRTNCEIERETFEADQDTIKRLSQLLGNAHNDGDQQRVEIVCLQESIDKLRAENERLFAPMDCGHPGANYSPMFLPSKSCLTCRAVEAETERIVRIIASIPIRDGDGSFIRPDDIIIECLRAIHFAQAKER